MIVSALIALVPRYFRCRFEMLSGPTERDFLESFMALAVMSVVKKTVSLSRDREWSL